MPGDILVGIAAAAAAAAAVVVVVVVVVVVIVVVEEISTGLGAARSLTCQVIY